MRRRLLLAVVVALVAAAACGPRIVTPSPSPSASLSPSAEPSAESASPTPTATPSRTPERTETPSPCDGQDATRGVAQTEKLVLVDRCRGAAGVVVSADRGADGSMKLRLALDYGQAAILNLRNMTELNELLPVNIVCVDPVPEAAKAVCGDFRAKVILPGVGAHVSVTGALYAESGGWQTIQPVWAVTPIPGPPPAPPASVVSTRKIWAQIREQWPMIPPAIVLAQATSGAVASASVYPDGIAHVFVGEVAPQPHVVWHEAGHVLQAVALSRRGHLAALYTANDDIGVAFWAARGFPGSWAASLTTGTWASLGYEAFAETFAAVSLGDEERSFTYGVPLDRNAMRVFFAGLVLTRP